MTEETRGQLSQILDEKTIASLKNQFCQTGMMTLSAGSGKIYNIKIQSGISVAVLSYATTVNPGTLKAVITNGQLEIVSSSGTDTSQVYYIIIF